MCEKLCFVYLYGHYQFRLCMSSFRINFGLFLCFQGHLGDTLVRLHQACIQAGTIVSMPPPLTNDVHIPTLKKGKDVEDDN